jgi:hypothetical protein
MPLRMLLTRARPWLLLHTVGQLQLLLEIRTSHQHSDNATHSNRPHFHMSVQVANNCP